MSREYRKRFPHHRGLAIPTGITARAWCTCRDACRDRSLVSGFRWIRWRGKRSRHSWRIQGSLTSGFLWIRWWRKRSRCMHNPQFYGTGKRPITRYYVEHCIDTCRTYMSLISQRTQDIVYSRMGDMASIVNTLQKWWPYIKGYLIAKHRAPV